MSLKDRTISNRFLSIDDLPDQPKKEVIVDFHARLPLSQRNKLVDIARQKGVVPNIIIREALKAFGI